VAITLYDATVPSLLQTLGGVRKVLAKGAAHAQAAGEDPEALAEARLIGDMRPLSFQVLRVVGHSAGALSDLQAGLYTTPQRFTADYASFEPLLVEAEAAVRCWSREEVDALADREVRIEAPGLNIRLAGIDFMLSFTLPNLYFHATTAYDILRMRGTSLTKSDYLGRLRLKT
jgi:hypothetical protein